MLSNFYEVEQLGSSLKSQSMIFEPVLLRQNEWLPIFQEN